MLYFKKLKQFFIKDMRISHVYQPLMIHNLLKNKGTLAYYTRSESMVNIQKEFPNEPSTFWLHVELLENDYLIKSLDYNIEVSNIPKLIKDFNVDAKKNNQLNATGICNAQGIY